MSKSPGSFKRIYPPEESIILDHGLNNKYSKALIMDSETPDCKNVEFTDRTVGTRGGAVKLNTTAVGVFAFDGFYTRRDSTANETMLAFAGGHMFTLAVTTFVTVPSAQSVFTMGQRVAMEFAENFAFMGNGGAGPYKWNGSNFTRQGVYPPPSTASVTSFTTGSLTTNGIYSWKITWENSALVQGDLGPATSFSVSSVGLAASLTSIPLAPTSYGVSARYVYRTIAGGSTYLRVAKISDNTTTTYQDITSDVNLGVQAPSDNGVPPQYNACLYHQGIFFCNDINNPNFVWYSVPGQPYTFPSTNFFPVGDKSQDLVKGFAAYDNHVVVFCEQSTYINFMPDPADDSTWVRIKTLSPFGSKSPYCALQVNGTVLHPAVQNKKFVGLARLRGNTLDPSSSLLTVTTAAGLLTSDKIEPDMFQVQESVLQNISGIVYKNQAYITLTYGSGSATNNRIYLYDYSMENLTPDQRVAFSPWTGLNIAQMTIYGGKLYGASSTTSGFVYQLGDTGVYSDDGSAIDSYLWTKELSGFPTDTNYVKDFRIVNVLVDLAGSYGMYMGYRVDSDAGTGTRITLSLTPGGSLWGTMRWGLDNWGSGASQEEKRVYLGSSIRGKRLQLYFSNQNTAGQRFKVHRLNFAYNLKGYR